MLLWAEILLQKCSGGSKPESARVPLSSTRDISGAGLLHSTCKQHLSISVSLPWLSPCIFCTVQLLSFLCKSILARNEKKHCLGSDSLTKAIHVVVAEGMDGSSGTPVETSVCALVVALWMIRGFLIDSYCSLPSSGAEVPVPITGLFVMKGLGCHF